MNPELQKQLANMLAKSQDAALWAAGQLPPLVREKLLMGRIEELAWLIFSSILCYVAYRLLRSAFPWDEDEEGRRIAACIAGGILSIIGSVLWLMSMHYALAAWFAPRVYIVEWLKEMIGK